MTLVHTPAGTLRGRRLGSVDAFLGIPYAAAPVGALRWRPPEVLAPWAGVREATAFGASAWQVLAPQGFGPWTPAFVVSGPISEDCLFLNVWAPAAAAAAPRPVLVWIHGGAFVQGSGAVPVYHGHALAGEGVIVVTVNYRLGVLGFLAHPELTRESDAPEACGNFGLLDQIAALRWVKSNIAAFGGDPEAVTVAGQSAGALSVHMLVASPLAQGLFQRAVALSGPPGLVPVPSRAQAEQSGLAFAAEVQQRDISSLRALPVEQLTRNLGPAPRFGPMVDGTLLSAWPPKTAWAPREQPLPMIVGLTADENSALDPDYGSADPGALARLLQRHAGNEAPAWLARHLRQAGGRVGDAYRAASRERWLTALWHELTLRGQPDGAPVFAYLFDHPLPGPEAERWGAFHTSDVPYALATLDALADRPLTPLDHQLSQLLSAYLLDFVRTGDPNAPGRPGWPALAPDAPTLLRVAAQTQAAPMFSADAFEAIRHHLDQGGSANVLD